MSRPQPAPRPDVQSANPRDLDAVVDTLVAAYTPTGLAVWLVPDPAPRAELLRGYLALHMRHLLADRQQRAARPNAAAWRVPGVVDTAAAGQAVAVWRRLRPGHGWLTAGHQPLIADYDRRLTAVCGPAHAARFVALDAAISRLLDFDRDRPWMYLAAAGTRPGHRRHGYMTTLLTHQHRMLDANSRRLPALTIAPDPATRTLLDQHGYRPHGHALPLDAGGPALQLMLRRPSPRVPTAMNGQ